MKPMTAREVAETIVNRITEDSILANQEKKADAGKLRYDLIEGSLLENVVGYSIPFLDIYPNCLTMKDLDEILGDCCVILGSKENFLKELAKVYTFGCIKYSEDSWKTIPNGRQRYEAGMFRHIDAFKRGEYVNEEDGGCLHVGQIAWNAIAVKWLITQEE